MASEEITQLKIMNVMALMQQGMSQRMACASLHISPHTFREFMQQHPETALEIVQAQQQILQTQFSQLTLAYQGILEKLLVRAEEATEPQEIMALEGRIRQLMKETGQIISADSKHNDSAADFLKGVTQKRGVSKITRTTETVEFAQDEEGNVIEVQGKELSSGE